MLVSSLPSRNKCLVIAVKNYIEPDFKVFKSCPILLDFSAWFQIFFQLVTMGASFKTGIISDVGKKGNYI